MPLNFDWTTAPQLRSQETTESRNPEQETDHGFPIPTWQVLKREYFLGRVPPVHFRNLHPSVRPEIPPEPVRIPALVDVVNLLVKNGCALVINARPIAARPADVIVALERVSNLFQVGEVDVEKLLQSRPLDLDHDFVAVRQPRSVDLQTGRIELSEPRIVSPCSSQSSVAALNLTFAIWPLDF